MSRIRNRLESYVVRNAGEVLDELADERREELAEVLHELEGNSSRVAEAESRADELVEKLEHRNVVIAKEREQRSDERLSAREQAVTDREAALASVEDLAATQKQSLERRKVQVVESERAVRSRAQSLDEQEARLAELERQLERRQEELA